MIEWITDNLGTIIVSLVLLLVMAGAVVLLVRDRKKGRSCCGKNCGACGMCSDCGASDNKGSGASAK